MAVADTKVHLFNDHFWYFHIKITLPKKILRQGSFQLPDVDFFWIIPSQNTLHFVIKLKLCVAAY